VRTLNTYTDINAADQNTPNPRGVCAWGILVLLLRVLAADIPPNQTSFKSDMRGAKLAKTLKLIDIISFCDLQPKKFISHQLDTLYTRRRHTFEYSSGPRSDASRTIDKIAIAIAPDHFHLFCPFAMCNKKRSRLSILP